MTDILTIQEVSKQYAHHKALDKVSMQIQEGSIFDLLGPNGAGKTSLIRILNQITAPDEGTVLFNGSPLIPEHQKLIGYLPEERGLYKKMKVGEQALYLAQLKGLDKKIALDKLRYWFKRFDIADWWDRRIEELSKGMQQKIQFITTVLHEPKLLIFDEPFTGFDPINVQLLKEEMHNLRANGATLILSTHNMESVEALCDNIALINKSKKILEGNVHEIKQQFKNNQFAVTVVGEINTITLNGHTLKDLRTSNGQTTFTIDLAAHSTANDLLKTLMNDLQIISFQEILPSMNEIFIKTVSNQSEHE